MNPPPYHIINNPQLYQNNYISPNFEMKNNQPIYFYTPPPNNFPNNPFDKNIRAHITHNVPNTFPIQNA